MRYPPPSLNQSGANCGAAAVVNAEFVPRAFLCLWKDADPDIPSPSTPRWSTRSCSSGNHTPIASDRLRCAMLRVTTRRLSEVVTSEITRLRSPPELASQDTGRVTDHSKTGNCPVDSVQFGSYSPSGRRSGSCRYCWPISGPTAPYIGFLDAISPRRREGSAAHFAGPKKCCDSWCATLVPSTFP